MGNVLYAEGGLSVKLAFEVVMLVVATFSGFGAIAEERAGNKFVLLLAMVAAVAGYIAVNTYLGG